MGSKSFEKRLAPPVDRRRIHYTPPPGDGRFHVWRGPLRISPPSESFVHGSGRFITASALKWDRLRTAGIVLMRLWRRRRAFTMRRERASERALRWRIGRPQTDRDIARTWENRRVAPTDHPVYTLVDRTPSTTVWDLPALGKWNRVPIWSRSDEQ